MKKFEIDAEKQTLVRSPDRNNIFFVLPKGSSQEAWPPILRELVYVIYPLSIRNADWKIVIPPAQGLFNGYAHRCVVLKDTTIIGEIKIKSKYSYHEGKHVMSYTIITSRLVGNRKIGYKETRDPKKAIKLATSFFYGLSPTEQYRKTVQETESALTYFLLGKQAVLRDLLRSNTDKILAYIGKVTSGISTEYPDCFMSITAADQEIKRAEAIVNTNGYYIHVQGDGNYVVGKDKTTEKVMRAKDFSDDLMTKITILKVAPDDTAVDDVGYRFSETSFFVKE